MSAKAKVRRGKEFWTHGDLADQVEGADRKNTRSAITLAAYIWAQRFYSLVPEKPTHILHSLAVLRLALEEVLRVPRSKMSPGAYSLTYQRAKSSP